MTASPGVRLSTWKTSRAHFLPRYKRLSRTYGIRPSTREPTILTIRLSSWPKLLPIRCRAASSRSWRRPGADQRTYKADFGKFARVFPDFSFKWNAKEGARELYETFKQIGLTYDDFTDKRFTRLKWLRYLLDTGRWTARCDGTAVESAAMQPVLRNRKGLS